MKIKSGKWEIRRKEMKEKSIKGRRRTRAKEKGRKEVEKGKIMEAGDEILKSRKYEGMK